MAPTWFGKPLWRGLGKELRRAGVDYAREADEQAELAREAASDEARYREALRSGTSTDPCGAVPHGPGGIHAAHPRIK